jgi:ADP-ribose pyrophosphatase
MTPEVLFQAQRFRIERVTYESSDGTRHAKEIVRHPGAVAIIPLLDEGHICFVENYRAAVQERLIELPAGTLEPPEEPLQTALRELAEETGYRAAHIELLTTLSMSPGILDEKMYIYVATGLTAGKTALEPGEDIRVAVVTWNEALEMIRRGRIRDAKSVASLLYYETFRRRK